jgi:hypothetical protein
MAAARREVAPCYREALARDSTIGGSLTLAIAVAPDGRVRRVTAEHDVPGPLASCAVDRVQRIGFPQAASDRPRVYVVPFVFNRTHAADDP